MPDANTLTIGILVTLARNEWELISSRTRAALQAKIAQGAKLGTPDHLTAEAKGAAANLASARADGNNHRAQSMAVAYRLAGMNLVQVASQFNRA